MYANYYYYILVLYYFARTEPLYRCVEKDLQPAAWSVWRWVTDFLGGQILKDLYFFWARVILAALGPRSRSLSTCFNTCWCSGLWFPSGARQCLGTFGRSVSAVPGWWSMDAISLPNARTWMKLTFTVNVFCIHLHDVAWQSARGGLMRCSKSPGDRGSRCRQHMHMLLGVPSGM